MKVIKVEDIDCNFSIVSQGKLVRDDNIFKISLWENINNNLSQILIQITDLTINNIDLESKICFTVKDERVVKGINILEQLSINILTKAMNNINVKGEFTFSSIVSPTDIETIDGNIIGITKGVPTISLNTNYADYSTTFISVNELKKINIKLSDLCNYEKNTNTVSQVCSVIIELMGIELNIESSHISLDIRLRLAKVKKISQLTRQKINNSSIFIDNDTVNNENTLVNQTVLEDVNTLINNIQNKTEQNKLDEQYINIINEIELCSDNLSENKSINDNIEDLDNNSDKKEKNNIDKFDVIDDDTSNDDTSNDDSELEDLDE
jgi:hypothetical protein